jgi:hypothetical protein
MSKNRRLEKMPEVVQTPVVQTPVVQTPVVQTPVIQKLTYKEFFLRNTGTIGKTGGFNRLLLGALEFFHGKEKHSEDEWLELYKQVSQRQTR